MAEITLKAVTGRELGSGPSKRLRVEGKVPGVVYGLDADPQPITVVWRELREVLTTDAGLNVLIDLDVDGEVALAVVKEIQRHAIRGSVQHIDFLRVSADVEISVDTPIVLEGEADEVTKADGTVDHVLFALTVNAKPGDIPNEIVVDISELTLGDTIRVADLKLPKGVSTDVDPEEAVVIAQISATTIEAGEIAEADEAVAAEQAEEAEAEAPAEGGDGEG